MQINFAGRTALVTGSTGGIGFAIARGFAKAGAKTYVNGRRRARLDDAVSHLMSEFPRADVAGVVADVSGVEGCQALAEAVPKVDILVNNAGIFELKDFFETTDPDWLRVFETNVMSGVRLARSYMRTMLEQGWGRIVFISSESAVCTPKEMIHYGLSKTAQLAVSRGLAELTSGTNVTVNAVLAGPTRSEGFKSFLKDVAVETGQVEEAVASTFVKAFRPTSLIQRLASVDEVANMVVYLASAQASATNGAALRVEGGIIGSIL